MRLLFGACALFYATHVSAAAPLMALKSDAPHYAVGAVANLEARPLVNPQDSRDEFYIGSTLNGVSLPLVQIPGGPAVSQPLLASAGTYTWVVQLFLENKKLAFSLNDTIQRLSLQNDSINTQIGQTTDQTQLAALEAQLAANNTEIQSATTELAAIRKPFGASQALTFTAQ